MSEPVNQNQSENQENAPSGLLLSVDPIDDKTKLHAATDDSTDADASDVDASDAEDADSSDDSDADGSDAEDADGTDMGVDADGMKPLGIGDSDTVEPDSDSSDDSDADSSDS